MGSAEADALILGLRGLAHQVAAAGDRLLEVDVLFLDLEGLVREGRPLLLGLLRCHLLLSGLLARGILGHSCRLLRVDARAALILYIKYQINRSLRNYNLNCHWLPSKAASVHAFNIFRVYECIKWNEVHW